MKKLALGVVALTSLAGTTFANFSLGDNANLFLTGSASVRYDDNIVLAQTAKLSDTIYEFDPGVEFDLGKKDGPASTVVAYTEAFTRYENNADLNTDLGTVTLKSTFKDQVLTGGFNAGYSQLDQNTPISGVPGLLRRNVTDFGGNGEYTISDKSKFGVGLTYEQTDYKLAGLSNSTIYTVPLNYYYAIMPDLYLSPGVRYRDTQLTAPGVNSTDLYYNLGLRRDIDPLLTGNISVGLDQRRTKGMPDVSAFGLDSSLTYKYSEKTTLNLNLSNDFGSAAAGTSQKIFSAGLGAQTQFAEDWSGIANVNYSSTDYAGGRHDGYWEVNVGPQWQVTKILSLKAAYDYKINSSNLAGSSYKDNIFSFTAVMRW